MSGTAKKAAGSSGVLEWVSSAYRFAMDRNDFRRRPDHILGQYNVVIQMGAVLAWTPWQILGAREYIKLGRRPKDIIKKCLLKVSASAAGLSATLFFETFTRNLLVNLGLFAAGVWVARNLSDFDLMSPQSVS